VKVHLELGAGAGGQFVCRALGGAAGGGDDDDDDDGDDCDDDDDDANL